MKSFPQWKVSLEPYNTRSPEMWSLIAESVSFEGKNVLDLGCGYGDMLLMSYYAGAKKIWGIDKNPRIISRVRERIDKQVNNSGIRLSVDDIESYTGYKDWDIIICFSVLPYLENPEKVLQRMQLGSEISLIEAQYYGEPYSLHYIKNDKDMLDWLRGFGWTSVTNLGYTDVEIRNAKRTIWRCRNA